tara:strand:- start:136 stop:291 length:156 start_codon:yes stop_codon:yes gene_type:complete
MGKTIRRGNQTNQPKPRKSKVKNRGRERQELRNAANGYRKNSDDYDFEDYC